MSPKDLPSTTAPPPNVQLYLKTLRSSGYKGEILTDYADRLINATDNSIYQILPQAVLAPAVSGDLNIIMEVAASEAFRHIRFVPRGGGTGTNGQSLNDCIVIDTSKHLTGIVEINKQEKWVKVEPGIVLDQLNAALEKHGLAFPVHISTSKSCTIGGMVATDACGKGSCVYGKTGDYVLSLTCVLSNGEQIHTDRHDNNYIDGILSEHYAQIKKYAPDLPRGLSAYDLLRAYNPDKNVTNFNRLFTGSEGSLAVIKHVKLRLIQKPRYKAMAAVFYTDFNAALEHVPAVLTFSPSAIETIDDHILALARQDSLWHDVQNILGANDSVKGAHFVEFESNDVETLNDAIQNFENAVHSHPKIARFMLSTGKNEIAALSALRSKCVGLLGNMDGNRRPIPFIEDTAVPPENLAAYIRDLKALFDKHQLVVGMFGHSDAGCLHVRPALDIRLEDDESLIRLLTDEVVSLVKRHGGILWGEHGKGMRSEYTEELCGTDYYAVMRLIKDHYDPRNKLNPGKIVTADAMALKKIDGVPLRGHSDREIADDVRDVYPKAMQCNGNGQCFSTMPDDTMCPSYKITRERKHSPKGRAALLREWMRLKSTNKKEAQAFAKDVHDALSGCLSCKACTSTCPIHVNIPDMKASFLHEHYKFWRRPVRDYLIGFAEKYASLRLLPLIPAFGLKDLPSRAPQSLRRLMRKNNFKPYTLTALKDSKNPVLIVQDAYTSFFEPQRVIAIMQFIRAVGFEPLVVPFQESGKSWHVRGFLSKFKSIANRNHDYFQQLAHHDVPMIGIDPSITLTYRDEYPKILKEQQNYKILLPEEWLMDALQGRELPKIKTIPHPSYKLFLHCTESTMRPQSGDEWQEIFAAFGVQLDPVRVGCCGMAGVYGHEDEHIEHSKGLYTLSWKNKVDETALVTGYSCRSQIARMESFNAKHPLELLNELLT